MSSILTDTKKALGIGEDDTAFDLDVMLQVNNAFSNLNDIGVGPAEGFVIEDDGAEWDEFFPPVADPDDPSEVLKMKVILSKVKNYVFLKTRLTFDAPAQGFLVTAMENQIRELESRISMNREATQWKAPEPRKATPPEEVEI